MNQSLYFLLQLVLIIGFAILQLYRMWLNAKVYREIYDYKHPTIYHAKNFSQNEIDKEQESSVFILFCFFTFIWFKTHEKTRIFQLRSNWMFLLSVLIICVAFQIYHVQHQPTTFEC